MPEIEKNDFVFPDEAPAESAEASTDWEIEIEDDTPEEDRGRKPADPAKVKALEVEVDELDKYSKDAKDKMIQMKRVWNDERRAREEAERERQAAIEAAQRLLQDNNRMKAMINSGQQEYKEAVQDSAELQLKMAKKAYKEAYEAGDAEQMMEAQEAIAKAALKEEKIKNFNPQPLQEEKFDVQIQQQYQPAPRLDDKVVEWQESNPWFGQDEEMTAAALGLHEKLKRNGVKVGSDEYYATLDKTMRKRFPENFEESEEVEVEQKEDAPKAKPKTVVAPATRSTASKKVKLKTSQVAIAKRLGLTPEQYVRELLKLEA
jgi:hypothetical protein